MCIGCKSTAVPFLLTWSTNANPTRTSQCPRPPPPTASTPSAKAYTPPGANAAAAQQRQQPRWSDRRLPPLPQLPLPLAAARTVAWVVRCRRRRSQGAVGHDAVGGGCGRCGGDVALGGRGAGVGGLGGWWRWSGECGSGLFVPPNNHVNKYFAQGLGGVRAGAHAQCPPACT